MFTEEKVINTIRLRTFLELARAEKGEKILRDALSSLNGEQDSLVKRLDEFSWISAKEEYSIVSRICDQLSAWPLIVKVGQECMDGFLENVLLAQPGASFVRDYVSWLPAFPSMFNQGLFTSYEESRDGKLFMLKMEGRNADILPGVVDVLFLQGMIEALLSSMKVPGSEIRLRTISIPMAEWPLSDVPAWLAFAQSASVLEILVGDLRGSVEEFQRRSPRLHWHNTPREAFVKQVIARSSRLFHDKRELSTAVEYLNMANDELEKELRHNKKELRMAASIQKGLIPGQLADWEGFRFAVRFMPQKEISGDVYDFFHLDANRAALMVGDVSGHGVPSALISAIVKIALHNHRYNPPSDLFAKLNLDLMNYVRMEGYLTAFFMNLDTNYELNYSIAAMPAPILLRFRSGEAQRLEGDGALLGMFPDAARFFSNYHVKLEPGDKLYIFTDGLIEAWNPQEEQFGEQRLKEAILETRDMDINEGCEHILNQYRQFVLGAEPNDDITLVGCMVSRRVEEFQELMDRAEKEFAAGRKEAACEALEAARQIMPQSPRTLYLLGKYLAMSGSCVEAGDVITEYRKLRPYDPNALTIFAYCLYRQGRYAEAEAQLLLSLEFKRENVSALYNLVKVYRRLNAAEKADKILRRLEELPGGGALAEKLRSGSA